MKKRILKKIYKEKWKMHDRNALCWSFYIVNDNNIVYDLSCKFCPF